ncbi:MAG: nucleotide sugar dehydrogenase [Gaiellaceae bacterium]
MSRIGIFGAGYVGLVTGTCFAALGHEVVVRDVLAEKIEALRRGRVPIYEPGLEELLAANVDRISFTTDVAEAIDGADFLYVAVGTPPTYSGDADLSAVWIVIDELLGLAGGTVVVMKSTVPPGTGEKVRAALDARGLSHVGYVSNPEFLAEGTALNDFMNPDRIVVGAFKPEDGDGVAELHTPLNAPVVRCDVASAEMIKMAANAFLSTRISFINEIANVCEVVGADVVAVAEGVGLDHRLGKHFLRAGIGFGGSCLDGRETVLARLSGRTWLTTLERLFAELEPSTAERAEVLHPDGLEVLAWRPDAARPEFLPVSLATRRGYRGTMLEVRTEMGRRVRCTPDHPFVVADGDGGDLGVKLAEELTNKDWLPLAQRAPEEAEMWRLDLLAGMTVPGLDGEGLTVQRLQAASPKATTARLRARLEEPGHRRDRSGVREVDRSAALRVCGARGLDLRGASDGTVENGTHAPAELAADEEFWRVVGLYIAKGGASVAGERPRIQWCFHPRRELDLAEAVLRFWRCRGIDALMSEAPTRAEVSVSSHVLPAWWLGVLGMGSSRFDQRIPDAIWGAPEAHKRALVVGMWRGRGSWSFVNDGGGVVLEYGASGSELADGLLRLLGDLGVVARVQVGRAARSTCETHRIVIPGTEPVESLLELVPVRDRERILDSLGRAPRRLAQAAYRRHNEHAAWVRVVEIAPAEPPGWVYSLEVPGAHTFVTTAGLIVDNCFPKDVSALKQLAGNSGYHFQLLSAVIEVNELQKRRVVTKLHRHLGSLRGKTVALLGLAFKPDTDDMREAPSLVIASRLLAEGADVRVWDPVADAHDVLQGVTVCESVLEAVSGADAAVIVTEWPELRELASASVRAAMAHPLIVDGRNLLDPAAVRAAGFAYDGIGRPTSTFADSVELGERDRELRS